jgi:hypothetical protein
MTLRPTTTTPTKRDLLQALLRKDSALELMDRQLLAEQIGFEKAGHHPTERTSAPSYEIRARALLNGTAHLVPDLSVHGDGARLADILVERRAIALALDVLRNEQSRTSTLALAEWMSDGGMDRWSRNRRRLADALLAVRAALADAVDIREYASRAACALA